MRKSSKQVSLQFKRRDRIEEIINFLFMKTPPSEPEELKEIFISHPKTLEINRKVDNYFQRLTSGVEKEEELWVRKYRNGDLVMETKEAVGDIITIILNLIIIDTKSSISSPKEVTNTEDLKFLLRKMDEQRKIENARGQAA